MKRLLSGDYNSITKEALCLPEQDLYDYYLNIANEHFASNPDLYNGLRRSIEYWLDWFKTEVYRGPKSYEYILDDVEEHPDSNELLERTGLPMNKVFGVPGYLYISRIRKQLEYLEILKALVECVGQVTKMERMLPIEARERLSAFPKLEASDLTGWDDRIEVMWQLADSHYGPKLRILNDLINKYDEFSEKADDLVNEILTVTGLSLDDLTNKKGDSENNHLEDLPYESHYEILKKGETLYDALKLSLDKHNSKSSKKSDHKHASHSSKKGSNSTEPKSTESQKEDCRSKIEMAVSEIGSDVFLDRKNYEAFVDMFEAFFSGQEVGNEKKATIRTKSRKKTKIERLLRALYKGLKPAGTLKHDTDYLELARVIDCLHDDRNVYKAITRTR